MKNQNNTRQWVKYTSSGNQYRRRYRQMIGIYRSTDPQRAAKTNQCGHIPGKQSWTSLLDTGFSSSSAGKESVSSAGDPGLGRSPEKGTATHSNILAWGIPWTQEPGGLQSVGSQRVRHNWATNTFLAQCCLQFQGQDMPVNNKNRRNVNKMRTKHIKLSLESHKDRT